MLIGTYVGHLKGLHTYLRSEWRDMCGGSTLPRQKSLASGRFGSRCRI